MPKENALYLHCLHNYWFCFDSRWKKVKKIQISRFINTELKSDSESDSDSDLEKIEAKIDNELESGSDSE